ncbi:unnamed protein product [Polarella glacialis]|uniref:ShKT domain-containing protein n=1 Tax=Polarella glacialis TaxID=89957 RepID=A0A813GA01_POLGL|nr:unnamed protein product [Polarella glacialis]
MEADDACGGLGCCSDPLASARPACEGSIPLACALLRFWVPGCAVNFVRESWVQTGRDWQTSELAVELGVSPLEILRILPLTECDAAQICGEQAYQAEPVTWKENAEYLQARKDEAHKNEECPDTSIVRTSEDTQRVHLVAGMRYAVVFRAMRLLDFEGSRPVLREDASQTLRLLPSPVRVIAFVGPGRCGKSFTLSRLAEDDLEFIGLAPAEQGHDVTSNRIDKYVHENGQSNINEGAIDVVGTAPCAIDLGPDAAGGSQIDAHGGQTQTQTRQNHAAWDGQAECSREKFPVGDDANPVTAGIDFCVIPVTSLPDGGVLLLLDCEGSDNPCEDNDLRCRSVTSLALRAASQLVQCDSTTVKESTLEDLAAMIKSSKMGGVGHVLQTDFQRLCMLVIACRFKGLDDSYMEDRVLADKEGQVGRNEMRSKIRTFFKQRCLRALPHLAEATAYEDAVRQLRKEFLQTTSPLRSEDGLLLDGPKLCQALEAIIAEIGQATTASLPALDETASPSRANRLVEISTEGAAVFEATLKGALPLHYAGPKLLEPFRPGGFHAQAALAMFDRLAAAENFKEGLGVAQARARVEERLEVLFHRLATQDAAFRAKDVQRCEALAMKLAGEFATDLPDRGRCWDDQELESWGAAKTAELEAVFARGTSRDQTRGPGAPPVQVQVQALCQEAVAEGRRSLRLRCWEIWQERLQANSRLRQVLEAAAERAHVAAFKACQDELPNLTGYVEETELLQLFEPRRKNALQDLERLLDAEQLLAQDGQSGFEAQLRERASGALAIALQRLLNDLRVSVETFRLSEITRATELAQGCIDELRCAMPTSPLSAPLMQTQLAEMDELSVKARQKFDLELLDLRLRCGDAVDGARRKFENAAETAACSLRAESLRKADAALRLRQGREESLVRFEETLQRILGNGSRYLEEAAWAREGVLGTAKQAAEDVLASICDEVLEHAVPGDAWEKRACCQERSLLAEALQACLDDVAARNQELWKAEQSRAEAAADRVCTSLGALIPDMPLRRALTDQSFTQLQDLVSRCTADLGDASESMCHAAWAEARERAATVARNSLEEVRKSNEMLKVQREDALKRALNRQRSELAFVCEGFLRQGTIAEAELQAASNQMRFFIQRFEDEAKDVIGDGVLVARGQWENELMQDMRAKLLCVLELEMKELRLRVRRLHRSNMVKLMLLMMPVLLAFLILWLPPRTRSQHVAVEVLLAAQNGSGIKSDLKGSRQEQNKYSSSTGTVQGVASDQRVPATRSNLVAAELEVVTTTSEESRRISSGHVDGSTEQFPERELSGGMSIRESPSSSKDSQDKLAVVDGLDSDDSGKADLAVMSEQMVAVEEHPISASDDVDGQTGVVSHNELRDGMAMAESPSISKDSQQKWKVDSGAILVSDTFAELGLSIDATDKEASGTIAADIEEQVPHSGQQTQSASADEVAPTSQDSMAPCIDKNDFCSDWAASGECQVNAAFMSTHCQRSCSLCRS